MSVNMNSTLIDCRIYIKQIRYQVLGARLPPLAMVKYGFIMLLITLSTWCTD